MNKAKLLILSCILSMILTNGGDAQTLQGDHAHPYQTIDIAQVFKLLPMFFQKDQEANLNVWKTKQSLWGEAEALLHELHQYNLDALYYRNMFHPVGQAIIFFGKTLNATTEEK